MSRQNPRLRVEQMKLKLFWIMSTLGQFISQTKLHRQGQLNGQLRTQILIGLVAGFPCIGKQFSAFVGEAGAKRGTEV